MKNCAGAVPLEIKRAHDLLEEQKDIKEKAHAEADQIIEQAQGPEADPDGSTLPKPKPTGLSVRKKL